MEGASPVAVPRATTCQRGLGARSAPRLSIRARRPRRGRSSSSSPPLREVRRPLRPASLLAALEQQWQQPLPARLADAHAAVFAPPRHVLRQAAEH